MQAPTPTRRPSATQLTDAYLTELMSKMKLDGWNQFTEQVKVPPAIATALTTGRPELLRIAPPPKAADLSDADVAAMFHLIGVLIETNHALQSHAQEVAKLVEIWAQSFTQLDSLGRRIESFANFQRSDESNGEDQ